MSTGYGYTSPPTQASVATGTGATCALATGYTYVTVSTYLAGVVNVLASSQPGSPTSGNGSIWFDNKTDWPLAVPMGLDSTGVVSAMVRMNAGSPGGPYYRGVGGALPTSTWMVYDNSSGGNTSEVIQAGASQSGNIWTVQNNSASPFWAVSSSGGLRGYDSSGTHYVGIVPASTITTYTFTLPAAQGSSGSVLTSAGGGTPMTWTTGVVLNNQVNTHANQSAPSTPSTGTTSVWTDSTDKNLKAKNDLGTVSVSVQPASAVSHEWISAISSAGAVTQSQPASTDLSDSTGALFTIIAGTGSADTNLATGSSYYGVGGSSGSPNESNRSMSVPAACTLRNFYFTTIANSSGSIPVTVRVNSASTSITANIGSGAGATYHDLVHTATMNLGDQIDILVDNTTGGATSRLASWSIGCFPN